MRVKRVYKFKKFRHKRIKRFMLFFVVLPGTSIFLGYLITSLLILPSMQK
jgi:hypothetical protein